MKLLISIFIFCMFCLQNPVPNYQNNSSDYGPYTYNSPYAQFQPYVFPQYDCHVNTIGNVICQKWNYQTFNEFN